MPVRLPHSNSISAGSAVDADCGPRALALVCQQLGAKTDVARLRVLAGTTSSGTSMAGLAVAARSIGLKAEGVQVGRDGIARVPLPAIAWTGNHFVAVLRVEDDGSAGSAVIHDPNTTEQTIPLEQLLRLSSGYLLLVSKR